METERNWLTRQRIYILNWSTTGKTMSLHLFLWCLLQRYSILAQKTAKWANERSRETANAVCEEKGVFCILCANANKDILYTRLFDYRLQKGGGTKAVLYSKANPVCILVCMWINICFTSRSKNALLLSLKPYLFCFQFFSHMFI